jgi:hypothetical protein
VGEGVFGAVEARGVPVREFVEHGDLRQG